MIHPPDLVFSSYSTTFTIFARWRFRLLFSAAYLSGILLSDCSYRAINLIFIQIRTPWLEQVLLPYSRPLYPAAQVLYIISLFFIATMGSSDPS
jgi:hypothetical protein